MRPTEEAARTAALEALRDWAPRLYDAIESGDASLHLCEDGETGWAFWVELDEDQTMFPEHNPKTHGAEVCGTNYVHSDLRCEGPYSLASAVC